MLYSSGLDVVLFGVRQWLVVEAWRLKSHYLSMVAGQKVSKSLSTQIAVLISYGTVVIVE